MAAIGVGAVSPTAGARDDRESDGEVGSIEQALETQWIQGSIEEHYGNAFNNGNGGGGLVLKSDVWYRNEAGNGVPPKVGETWIGAAHVGVFDPNLGSTAVEFVVKPPPNTSLAIDKKHGITCSYIPQGGGTTFVDVTKDAAANCPSAPTQTAEGWSLGTRQLAKLTQFAIAFPLKSTAPLRGVSGPDGGDKLRVTVRPEFADTKEPYVYAGTSQPTAPRQLKDIIRYFLACLWRC